MATKSNVLSSSNIIVTVLCAFMYNIIGISCVGHLPNYKELEIIDDLPVKSNLEKYLVSLEKIISFVNLHRFYTDRHLFVGLFLIGVNLRTIFGIKSAGISQQQKTRLAQLLNTTDEIETYFVTMVYHYTQNLSPNDVAPVSIINLFMNESIWPIHMGNFNLELLNKTEYYTRKELEQVYFKWPLYKQRVYSYIRRNNQSPSEADICLELLSQNPLIDETIKLTHCQVPYACAKRVLNGTRFGFARLSRLTFLILARFSRGCTLLSHEEDKHLVDSLCASAYNEAEFTAYHDFETIDLLMEIMALCGLEGHAQFLRRSWIDEAIDFQSSLGCFNLTKPMEEPVRAPGIEHVPWQFTISEEKILDGSCNIRSTAAAAGMLSAAIRYILEYHY